MKTDIYPLQFIFIPTCNVCFNTVFKGGKVIPQCLWVEENWNYRIQMKGERGSEWKKFNRKENQILTFSSIDLLFMQKRRRIRNFKWEWKWKKQGIEINERKLTRRELNLRLPFFFYSFINLINESESGWNHWLRIRNSVMRDKRDLFTVSAHSFHFNLIVDSGRLK